MAWKPYLLGFGLILFLLAFVIYESDARRIGGGFSRGRFSPNRNRNPSRNRNPTRNRGGSTSSRRPAPSSRNGLYNRRNTGYGTYRTRRTPLPRTSLYSRQYGNFYGRRSSSYNGFGLGMGAGLLIGYRFGVLSRPIGYGGFGYNYRYIHEHRSYNKDRPYTCTATNVTEFIKTMDSAQELNIDEGEIMCSLEEDVCFGKITVLEANITMADGSGTREGFEIKIEKGCGRRSEFSASNNTAKYDSSRQCWTSRVDNRTLASLGDNSTAVAENVIPEKLIEVLGLKGKSMREASVSSQFELCVCTGSYCNLGTRKCLGLETLGAILAIGGLAGCIHQRRLNAF